MIGTIDIRINAAKPNFPLSPFYAFINSPSQVRVVNVPRSIGDWEITKVYVSANYPDNTSRSVECTLTGGCWHGTLPASTATGTSTNGFAITADGVTEDGETAITGYVLGKGDLEILDTDGTITVGETTYYIHLLDAQPTTPHKGDICLISGAWKIYNGTAWIGFGGGGDVAHSDFTDVSAIADRYTLADVKGKVNEVLNILKGSTVALALMCASASMPTFADISVQTCVLSNLYSDASVVTNVSGAATDPGVVSNIVEAYGYATTNYVDAAIAGATPGDYANVSNRAYAAPVEYAWSSPDEWMIAFTSTGTTTRSTTVDRGVNDGFCIISNEVVSTTLKRVAQASPVTVDETSLVVQNVTNWSVSSGASVTSDGVVSSQTDGVYRVTARSSNGTVRYGDVILVGDTVVSKTNAFHAADVAGSGTKAVNDTALAALTSATKVGDYTRGGVKYAVYNAQKVYITQVGAGNVKPFAVSAHVLASAKHYWVRPLGTQTFTDADGNSATVTKKQWVDLKPWALANGWSEAEVSEANIADISLIVCDTATAVPDGCIPYFMSEETATGYYDKGQGLAAWQCSQYHEYAMPVTLRRWDSATYGFGEAEQAYYTRSDILTRLEAMGTQNYLVSGDSGRPFYIIDRLGRTVVTFANKAPYSGANYVKGFKIIKAFVEAQGDTIKEAN